MINHLLSDTNLFNFQAAITKLTREALWQFMFSDMNLKLVNALLVAIAWIRLILVTDNYTGL